MKYLPIICILFAATSCKKFLTTQPTDSIVTSNFYQNEKELNSALTGVYAAVIAGSYADDIPNVMDMSDEAYSDYGYMSLTNNMYFNNFDYTNTTVNGFWATQYTGIENANLLIANINNVSMDSNVQNILGQALFLRGFAYYQLVSHFGDVPLKLTPTASANNTNTPRTPSAKVYAAILSDMETALPMLESAAQLPDGSRISQTAAEGIIARVCLSMAGQPLNLTAYYDTAINYCQAVVHSGLHALNTSKQGVTIPDSSYANIFINEAQDKFDAKECMFEAVFSGTTTTYSTTRNGGSIGFHSGIPFSQTYNDASIGYNYAYVYAPATLYRLYGPGDLRRDWAISPYYYGGKATNPSVSAAGITHIAFGPRLWDRVEAKWRREFETLLPKSKYDSPEDFPILRYADILLMLAEAELMAPDGDKTDALNNVNMVRRRGYGFPINAPNAVSDLKSLAIADIQDERERELCFEGLRWTDLRRWGIYMTKMQAMVDSMQADGLNTWPSSGTNEPQSVYYVDGYQSALNAVSSTKYLLLPIPTSEMNVNTGATQNPGY